MSYFQQRAARDRSNSGSSYGSRSNSYSGGYGSGSSYSKPSRRNVKENIHPSRFVKAAKAVEAEVFIPVHQFADFDLHDQLKANVAARGYVNPSPIQDQAIPIGLAGTDIIGIANTGTGKTAAFALPALHRLMTDKNSRVLIMAPTRELAQQIEDECRILAKDSGIRGALLIGGSSFGVQIRDLMAKPNIVIGTPGRIKDHLDRGRLDLNGFNMVVLDEVDRMLDMGFVDDITYILSHLPENHQSFFFTATIEPKVRGLINRFSVSPETVSVKTGDTVDSVEQNIVEYGDWTEKVELLHEILITDEAAKVLIFDDTQISVEDLSTELQDRGFKADAIHGGKNQVQRQRALNRFKESKINVLVATDVAARGIDVSDITHVINYSTPKSYDDYVHRIGRAGRAGKTGNALTFVQKRRQPANNGGNRYQRQYR
jgi:superfamily II DNA/RNA helicase